ncbi:MAG: hypothetical protein ABIN61_09005 [candidate division WOR-3 bacterium]
MGRLEEDPIGDSNNDGFPGVRGVDDDGDGLIDEDSRGRQPGESGYTNDLAEDDDEDGYYDINQGKIIRLNEDPGRWDHIIMIRDYRWIDWHDPLYAQFEQTLGHAYNFIHACPDPGWTTEVFYNLLDYRPRYPIVHTQFNQTGRIYRTEFRQPNR